MHRIKYKDACGMKKISILCIMSVMSILMFGCSKQNSEPIVMPLPSETIIVENLTETFETEGEENVSMDVESPTEILSESVDVDAPLSASELVVKAYDKMRQAEMIKAVTVSPSGSGGSEITLHWNNATGEFHQADFSRQNGEDFAHETSTMERYVVLENGCYVVYSAFLVQTDGVWTVQDVSRYLDNSYSSHDFTEMFSGSFNLKLSDEFVDINGEPHYYLQQNQESDNAGDWNMYIKCSDYSLSRLELANSNYSQIIDFEETNDPIVVPQEIKDATAHISLEYGQPDENVVFFPALGHEWLSNPTSVQIEGIILTLGNRAYDLLNNDWVDFHCELSGYYIENNYLHNEGGAVPAGGKAWYCVETDSSRGGFIIITVNDTDEALNPEDCVIKGILHSNVGDLINKDLTLLDAVVSIGHDYEILPAGFNSCNVKWILGENVVYITTRRDVISNMFVVHQDLVPMVEGAADYLS